MNKTFVPEPVHLPVGRKVEQVLQGAAKVFLRDGFEGASVDDIAREAGVSKATLYSYFADKRVLFLEVARLECARQTDAAVTELDFAWPPRVALRHAAAKMMAFFLSDFGRQVYRVCVAESERFPELAREFYYSGPMRGQMALKTYLEMAVARGDLLVDDFELAAAQFPALCKAELHYKLTFGIQTRFEQSELDRIAESAIDMFLARYGA
ncbi:MAG: TetR/AcrR family transcriptional regulator [Pseudomonadota bacterium]